LKRLPFSSAKPQKIPVSRSSCESWASGLDPDSPEFIIDERLREKEFGILDRLTRSGIEQVHPQQAEYRRFLGKFYH